MQPIDWRVVIRAVEVIREGPCTVEEGHPQALSTAVRLQDERTIGKTPASGLDEQLLAADYDRVRGADAGCFESRILARLADLEVEGAAAIDDSPPMPFEPGQHEGGQLRGVTVIAGVRGGAHPVVEDP